MTGTGTQMQTWTTGVTTIALLVLRTGELKSVGVAHTRYVPSEWDGTTDAKIPCPSLSYEKAVDNVM